MIRTYHELISLETFEDRFDYLSLRGTVGKDTFGSERYLNQTFYRSKEWRDVRNHVIARDNGCDLGIEDRPIFDMILVHHMNPMQIKDLENFNTDVINPDYLISVSHDTHNAIHYGSRDSLILMPPDRMPGDTTLWRKYG